MANANEIFQVPMLEKFAINDKESIYFAYSKLFAKDM